MAGLVGLLALTGLGLEARAQHDAVAVVAAAAGSATPDAPSPASTLSPQHESSVAAAAARAQVRTDPTPATKAQKPPTKVEPKKVEPKKVSVPDSGPGTYRRAHEKVAPASSRGTLKRYDVRVEKGLDIDPDAAALLIAKVLNDKRSWTGTGRWRFQLVSAGQSADLHIHIVTPGTTDRLCAPLLTHGDVSCQNGNRVVLNAKRWVFGVKYYGDDVKNYRRYLINHEVGHALGFNHVGCPGSGQPAPVMMQQTKGLGSCRKNPWPRTTGD